MISEVAKIAEIGQTMKTDIPGDNVDISKRIDTNKKVYEKPENEIDVSKRISVPEDEEKKELPIDNVIEKYVADLKEKSKFADTISDDCIDKSKLEIKSPEEVKKLREEFDDIKKELIAQWCYAPLSMT